MQIVIDIPNSTFTDLKKKKNRTEVDVAVLNGTPLPKGHGRLCDLDAALKCVDDDSVEDCDAKWQAIRLFEWAMTKRVVIEADKT